MKAGPSKNRASSPETNFEEICDRFEAACKAAGASGPMPSPETYLEGATEASRPDLLHDLLILESDYSQKRLKLAKELKGLSEKLAPLKILGLIGQGGMGSVYKALADQGQLVAVKVLPPEFSQDKERAERFEKEAKVLAQLDHHNIVALHPIWHADDDGSGLSTFMENRAGLAYFVMDYAEGGNLRARIGENGVSPTEAIGIILQVCKGLQHAHHSNVIHRDIKPENILVDRQGQMKIADFGLAKVLDSGQTKTSQGMGTPGYMAPEQERGAKNVDCRADIYSLGVVFYELLTGSRLKHLSDLLKGHVDKWLHDIVVRALENNPDDRFQQVDDLIKAIQLGPLVLGTVVQGRWRGGQQYYQGKITEIAGEHIHIDYDDGDKEWTTANLIRLVAGSDSFALGTVVQCRWKGGEKYYQGKITGIDGDRIHVDYDDGDEEWTTADMIQQ